jgi:hypothetical protein
VLSAGEKNAACMNATLFAAVSVPIVALAYCGNIVLGSTSLGKSMCHKLVSRDLVPVMTIWSSCLISMVSRFTVAVHPASHNCPTDIRLRSVISGTICVRVASGGSPGMLRCPWWVDVMVLPSGMVMMSGLYDLVTFTSGCSMVAKCVVHPVSIIVGGVMVGGPKVFVVVNVCTAILLLLLLISLGSPPRQAVSSVVPFLLNFFRLLAMLNSQHPFIISSHVASF